MICCCSRKAADRWPDLLPRRHLNAQEGPAGHLRAPKNGLLDTWEAVFWPKCRHFSPGAGRAFGAKSAFQGPTGPKVGFFSKKSHIMRVKLGVWSYGKPRLGIAGPYPFRVGFWPPITNIFHALWAVGSYLPTPRDLGPPRHLNAAKGIPARGPAAGHQHRLTDAPGASRTPTPKGAAIVPAYADTWRRGLGRHTPLRKNTPGASAAPQRPQGPPTAGRKGTGPGSPGRPSPP